MFYSQASIIAGFPTVHSIDLKFSIDLKLYFKLIKKNSNFKCVFFSKIMTNSHDFVILEIQYTFQKENISPQEWLNLENVESARKKGG